MGKVVNVFLDPFGNYLIIYITLIGIGRYFYNSIIYIAAECKLLLEKMTEEKPKPPPDVPKIKPLPTSNRDRRSVKSVKPKEEPVAKPQTEEKILPLKVENYKNYNYDYTTPSPATSSSDLPSEKSYSSGYNSMGTPGYNGTYPYSYNRFVICYFPYKTFCD